MRILIVSSLYLPKIGGVQLAVHNLAEGLCEAGQDVHLLAPKPRGPEGEPITLYQTHWFAPLPFTGRLGLWNAAWRYRLARLIKRIKPDVVHAHVAYPAGYVAADVCKRLGIPMALTCHGNDIQKLPEIGYGKRLDPAYDKLVTKAVRGSSGLVAIGSDIRSEYLDLGVDPACIAELPNGINFGVLAPPDPNARQRIGIPENAFVYVAVGRNHPKKGFPFFLESMRLVFESDPDAVCVIVGARVPQLGSMVGEALLGKKVFLFDVAPPVGVSFRNAPSAVTKGTESYFHAADVFVMPSLIESFGLVTVEAFAAGLPVVAMDAEGSRDLLTDSESTMLVPSRDPAVFASALLEMGRRIRKNPGLGQRNIAFAAQYDRRRIGERHVTFYQALIDRTASRADMPSKLDRATVR